MTLLLAVLSVSLSSCSVEPLFDPGLTDYSPEIEFRIYVPDLNASTRATATPGDIPSLVPESHFYDVQAWAFIHGAADSDAALAYIDASDINMQPGDTWEDCYKMKMRIPEKFLTDNEDPKIDFYLFANWRSVFDTKPGGANPRLMTLAQVRDLTYGVSTAASGATNFGAGDYTTAVPASKGLPISTIYKGADNQGVSLAFMRNAYLSGTRLLDSDFKNNIDVIPLTRAVSKVKFVVVKPEGQEGVRITKIVLNEGIIPDSGYIFPHTAISGGVTTISLPSGTLYAGTSKIGGAAEPLMADASIFQYFDPERLTRAYFEENHTSLGYSACTTPDYELYLNSQVTGTTSTITTYFRESDKPVSGTIYYRLSADDTEDKTATFTMDRDDIFNASADSYNNFTRNHAWTVYAYFKGGALFIRPVVVRDWEYTESTHKYQFNQAGEARVMTSDKTQSLFGYGWSTAVGNNWNPDGTKPTEWYFRRQDSNGQGGYYPWTDWVHSQMVSAPGLNAANTPVYANRMELDTYEFNVPLRLKLSNPDDFFLVTYSTAAPNYVVTTSADGVVIPLSISSGGFTYFYVVPKDTAPEGATTGVYLVTEESSPVKLPFNASAFPGAQDNTEIYYYAGTPPDRRMSKHTARMRR